ncbi:hypothetical protein HRI96_02865 [Treponema parvum]|uniref:Uncharacterized protein n=1 Tax=Treponema parvum TaxID=138851 RepID=A0A975EYU3_9SPIR|nr:adenine-specific methyltransferase EcoRI family protein [Treponema parvum]QTQ11227.1 hypothetical protein HRI96_02865 [Treponema parvum]
MTNFSLQNAKKQKNDEFYTQYSDIQKEVKAYVEFNDKVFKNKTVFLPCDDPDQSNFTKFFVQNFKKFELKKLISTCYAGRRLCTSSNSAPQKFCESSSAKNNAGAIGAKGKMLVIENREKENSSSNECSKIFCKCNLESVHLKYGYLKSDGDFRSDEMKKLRNNSDIIVTNPPFSLFREFLAWIFEADKKFLLIGSMNAITYKEVFPLIKDNKLWLGATGNGSDMVFAVPEGTRLSEKDRQKAARMGYSGNYTRLGNSCWFTNLDHSKRHRPLKLMTMEENLHFSRHTRIKENGYPKYDNYDAIEVSFSDAIPSDYNKAMGVPISFLHKYCPEQFEIIKFRKGNDEKDLTFTILPSKLSQKPEARSQKPEARSQKPEARSQKPEARSQKPEARSQKPEARRSPRISESSSEKRHKPENRHRHSLKIPNAAFGKYKVRGLFQKNATKSLLLTVMWSLSENNSKIFNIHNKQELYKL